MTLLPNPSSCWRAAAALCLLLCHPSLRAHDLWIEPDRFRPEPGQVVNLRLQVGTHLAGEPLPLIPPLIKRFFAREAAAAQPIDRPVASRRGAGAEPAGQWRAGPAGLHIVSYQSHASRVALDGETFNAYLLEEGLEALLEQRTQRGQRNAPTSERFARCAKSLLLVGEAHAQQRDLDVGCTLELVAEANPYTSAELPFRLSYLGKPLAGTLVVAMNAGNPAQPQSARTDADGRVRLTLTSDGMWLVKAVHTVPAAAGIDAEWQSWWASITFKR